MSSVAEAISWAEVAARVKDDPTSGSVYDWCWVCGVRLGPDKLHVMIPTVTGAYRHTYCCRKHRYVTVEAPNSRRLGEPTGQLMVQERSDHEIESLAWAFKAGELEPGWE